ncbi:hypothetical protein GCM10009119_39560 [Algoriphagus jejuensis]|uniref:TIR domain-containing protein n=1 Tax=Algoriphagus jejuensis TaxID=419934 RepID=A0ABN1N5B7_9BACT
MASGKIFISYRREDTSGESGRLKDKLEQVFGQENIFYDVETLEAGLNFDQSIAKALGESKVLLAMIGPHWLKVVDSKGVSRLQKPDDWVRKEIAEALKRELRVIPVLVNGAEMPDPEDLPEELKELSLKHAQELTSSRWNYDVGELTKVLEKIITKKPQPTPDPIRSDNPQRPVVPPVPQPKSWWAKNYLWMIGGLVGFLILIGMCVPDDLDTYPEYQEQASTDFDQEANIIPESASGTDLHENDQNSGQFIPDISGEWDLYLNGQKVSVLAFSQNGADVAYYEYDLLDTRTAEGQGKVAGTDLLVDYYNTTLNVNGTISMSTDDDGLTWYGIINFPVSGFTGTVNIRKTNP